MTTDSLLLTSDVARRLQLSPSTITYYERKGRLRAMRTVGGVRLFFAEDVERLATERARGEHRTKGHGR